MGNRSIIKEFIKKEFNNYDLTDLQSDIVEDIFLNHFKLIQTVNSNKAEFEMIQAYADNIKASIVNSINIARVT